MTLTTVIVGSTKPIIKDLNRIRQKVIPVAEMRGKNKALAKVLTQSAREISQATRIQQKVIRTRLKKQPATRTRKRAKFTVLTLPIPARKLGMPRQTGSGAKAGKHQFPGAFVQTMPAAGRRQITSIFKRLGKARLPIKQQSVVIENIAVPIATRQVNTTGFVEFRKEFERQFARMTGK